MEKSSETHKNGKERNSDVNENYGPILNSTSERAKRISDNSVEKNDILFQIIDCVKIYKTAADSVVALRKIRANIYKGEITIIMGPSGAGKTTLLNILGGIDKADAGSIIYDGKDLVKMEFSELEMLRENFGFLFQFSNLIPELTVRDNFIFSMYVSGRLKTESYRSLNKHVEPLIIDMLKRVGLSNKIDVYPDELSGGEQQRIALLCALIKKPKVLFCDEPTGELDTKNKIGIFKLLKEALDENPDMSIIIATHDDLFKKIADRLLIIRDGQIIHESRLNIPYSAPSYEARNGSYSEISSEEYSMKSEGSDSLSGEMLTASDFGIKNNKNTDLKKSSANIKGIDNEFDNIIEKKEILQDLLELDRIIKDKIRKLM